MPDEVAVVKQSLNAGQAYNGEARSRKEEKAQSSAKGKEPGEDAMEEEDDLGPPHLRIGAEGLEALIMD